MRTSAVFHDGQSARNHPVEVGLDAQALTIQIEGQAPVIWSLPGLHAVDPPAEGQAFRLTHDAHVGQRLIIRDGDFVKATIAAAPRLRSGYFTRDYLKQAGAWTVAGLAGLAALGYGAMALLPHLLAPVLPERVKTEAAAQVVKGLTEGARECDDEVANGALAMLARKLGGADVKIHVHDMDLLNAFAVPGNAIILTREVIKQADTPDEVAGVLAHEMGHAANLHPEQQLVRLLGLQAVLSIFSGGGGGETVSNVAGLVALFSYSREAEREADAFARTHLTAAAIDPLGFKHFFEKIQKLEGTKTADSKSVLSRIGNILATHPGTEDRIKLIEPLPAGVKPVPALSAAQWKAVKGMCSDG